MKSTEDPRSNSAAETPLHRRELATRLLSVAVVLTCAGVAAATWRGDGSSINSFLFLALRLSHETAAGIERSAMGAVLAAAVFGAIWPRWVLLLPVSAYLLAEALAGWHQGGYPFSEWTPLARAPAYLAPLALALLATRKTPATASAAMWILRVAMAALFLAHGLEAFHLHPRFIDLILSSSLNLTGIRLNESGASTLLRVIGVVDVGCAAALLIRPWRVLLGWMAFWAGLAAASRLTAHGWGAYPELLVRSSYFLAPLAVWALLGRGKRPARALVEPPEDSGSAREGLPPENRELSGPETARESR